MWDFSNTVLYDLCRLHPTHTRDEEIIAKILLIGRVYAAAIERRRNKEDDHESDRFYTDTVAPAIRDSRIDEWLQDARAATPGTEQALKTLVQVHGETTKLFEEISQLEKRSLASKYLHFHVPNLFFIFDSRAVEAIREFSDVLPRATRDDGSGDNEYRKYSEKATALTTYCEEHHRLRLTPRQLDNLLLRINE